MDQTDAFQRKCAQKGISFEFKIEKGPRNKIVIEDGNGYRDYLYLENKKVKLKKVKESMVKNYLEKKGLLGEFSVSIVCDYMTERNEKVRQRNNLKQENL